MLRIEFSGTNLVLQGECYMEPLIISQHWFR